MPAKDIKKELLSFIENTNDEALLTLLKEDFIFYGEITNADITNNLTPQQLQELNELAAEDNLKDTQTLVEFKKVTNKWRTR